VKSLETKQINNLFEWLDEIMLHKSDPQSFSQESWDKWNSYMVHRYLSMNISYIDIVNYVQKINPQNKQQIYTIYREMIPKKKLWLKYVKNENKRNLKQIPEYIAEYFNCSLGEAENYIDILRKHGVKGILWEMGLNEEETNKLLKEAKL
jgi:hypothetical protein